MLLYFWFRKPGQDLWLSYIQLSQVHHTSYAPPGTDTISANFCVVTHKWSLQMQHDTHHSVKDRGKYYQSRKLLLKRLFCFLLLPSLESPEGMDKPFTKNCNVRGSWCQHQKLSIKKLCLGLPDIHRQGKLSETSQLSTAAVIICKEMERREKASLVSLKLIYSNGNVIRKDQFSSQ